MTLMIKGLKVAVVLLASLLSGCRAGGGGESAGGRRGERLELARLQVGSVYGVGSRFASDNLEFVIEGYGEGLGNAEVSRAIEAAAGSARSSKDAGPKTLRLSHATLRCRSGGVNHLEFDFSDNGGSIALEIAGETRRAADFVELDGLRLGPALIAVSQSSTAGVRHGRVVVSGAIGKFAISGADLEVADLRLSRGD